MHTATLLGNGRVLITGGSLDVFSDRLRNPSAAAELYDPDTRTFLPTGSLATPRALHTATCLDETNCDQVLVIGGTTQGNGASSLDTTERYDRTTGAFASGPSLSRPRQAHTATRLADGRILIVGGYDGTVGALLATAELYEPQSGRFVATGRMSHRRQLHQATRLSDGRVLITGGLGGPAAETTLAPLATAELYDPVTGQFQDVGPMGSARFFHQATLLEVTPGAGDGRVLITGGAANLASGASSLGSAELFDPASGRFLPTAPLLVARQAHTATLLTQGASRGRVLLTGGSSALFETATRLTSAELYDPQSGTFSTAGDLGAARQRHTATVLSTGDVLIAGGHEQSQVLEAERYTPSAVSVSLMPGQVTLAAGTSQRFTVNVAGTSNTSVTYSLPVGAGSIGPSGDYTAPSAPGTYTLTATSQADPQAAACATIVVVPVLPPAAGYSLHTATPLADGRILIAGGIDQPPQGSALGGIQARAELYTPTTRAFRTVPMLQSPRVLHTATRLPGGDVLIAGGLSLGGSLATSERFNPASQRFVPAAALAMARQAHTATALDAGPWNGRVLVAGGYDTTTDRILGDVELYDPDNDRFEPVGFSLLPRQLHTASLVDLPVLGAPHRHLLFIGGTGTSGPVADIEAYDLETGVLRTLGRLGTPRYLHETTPLGGGRLLITGGIDGDGRTVAAAEIVDLTTGNLVLTVAGNLRQSRYLHRAERLADGRIVLLGGSSQFQSTSTLDTVEIYDPALGRFLSGGRLANARQRHSATLLGDGSILLIGGHHTSNVLEPEFYRAPTLAAGDSTSWGDPHLITYDGLAYDFQAVGEFILTTDNASFVVQARQQLYPLNTRVAINTAMSTRIGGHRVAIYVGQSPPLRIDGVPTALGPSGLGFPGAGRITGNGGRYTITWDSGERVSIAIWGYGMNISPSVPAGQRGRLRGLLGNFDGNGGNEFMSRAGQVYAVPSFSDLYGGFGNSWRISQAESLFDYPSGQGTANYTDTNPPPGPATSAALAPAQYAVAQAACRGAGISDPGLLEACIVDVGFTGDTTLAQQAAEIVPPTSRVNNALPTNCANLLAQAPGTPSGIYTIDPDGNGPGATLRVYCDMTTDGGGWTLVGKGRQGWTWSDAGQGTSDEVLNTTTFNVAYLPSATVQQIVGQTNWNAWNSELRIIRESGVNDRWFMRPTIALPFAWSAFQKSSTLPTDYGGCGQETGSSRQATWRQVGRANRSRVANVFDTLYLEAAPLQPIDNDCNRVFTVPWAGHGCQAGFSAGYFCNLGGSCWVATNEGHCIPHTTVWVRN